MIENLECRSVQVHRYNNACAYPEGSDLTLRRVYIDSSEQGLLTGAEPGCVRIPDSIFENLGMGGQTHATHLDGEELEIDGSYTPSSKSEAHCVKTRADRTYVSNSVIASIEIPRVAKQA